MTRRGIFPVREVGASEAPIRRHCLGYRGSHRVRWFDGPSVHCV